MYVDVSWLGAPPEHVVPLCVAKVSERRTRIQEVAFRGVYVCLEGQGESRVTCASHPMRPRRRYEDTALGSVVQALQRGSTHSSASPCA